MNSIKQKIDKLKRDSERLYSENNLYTIIFDNSVTKEYADAQLEFNTDNTVRWRILHTGEFIPNMSKDLII